jgi:hypothetical protein
MGTLQLPSTATAKKGENRSSAHHSYMARIKYGLKLGAVMAIKWTIVD